MTIAIKSDTSYILRFDSGEEVIKCIEVFCAREGIGAASFSAIGAAHACTLSFYDLRVKAYRDETIQEDLEVIGLLGNVALLDGAPVVHAHGTLSDKDFNVHGGHVKQLVVSVTCEVMLTVLQGKLNRKFSEETGLNLLQEQ